MGHHKWLQISWLFVSIMFLSSLVQSSQTYDHESLEDLLCKQVNKDIVNPKTGVFYNISLPSNYTGMEVRVVRLRTSSFYKRGVNSSFFNVPPHVVPQPIRKRMAILYENFGNWSSHYFNVPNYTMVAPVFGFVAYTSSGNSFMDNEKMNLVITQGNPILIHFHHVRLHEKNDTPICVKFSDSGNLEFNNMTKPYVCETYGTGHYTLVVPIPKELYNKRQSKRFTIWWILGFVLGFVGLVVLILLLVTLVKAAKKTRIKKLERNSENGESFDTFWIGETKLPLAPTIRTQPVLEND
ncbi:hypothetical protein MtrunA17_Chr8g0347761 [Medicago truncatula]|uniref:Plant/F17O14-7 protein n=1 Tax=Medicago truncatula TaxID=3880 RepID=G7ZYQ4_MEDTR|nr:uncharacterized protein LOC25500773 [Medicago truncatula]KEH18738.1 plant/F17O14-7 protein [Medicago truncatula]RHN39796.1 hypothetical protein MtrunA17_Chr8g0347761 [Medicago truncatula]